jgi:hypothetical protein
MIITNSADRPSNRFIEVVKPYFESQGYEFKKTKKEFHRPFEKGKQIVGFWFRIGVLTNACLYWRIQFEKLEKICSTIEGKPNSYKSAFTIATNQSHHTRWEENPEHTFDLYDESTLYYDDFSINSAAQKVIAGYEKYTIPYFKQYSDYPALYEVYAKQDFRQTRQIILAVYLALPETDKLISKFKDEVFVRNDPREIALFEKTINFISTEDIRHWLE